MNTHIEPPMGLVLVQIVLTLVYRNTTAGMYKLWHGHWVIFCFAEPGAGLNVTLIFKTYLVVYLYCWMVQFEIICMFTVLVIFTLYTHYISLLLFFPIDFATYSRTWRYFVDNAVELNVTLIFKNILRVYIYRHMLHFLVIRVFTVTVFYMLYQDGHITHIF